MDIILKNVKKKDFPVLKSLAKSLGFEIVQNQEKPYNTEFVNKVCVALWHLALHRSSQPPMCRNAVFGTRYACLRRAG